MLQRRNLILAYMNVRQFAETSRYAVHRTTFVNDCLDNATRSRHSLRSIRMEDDAPAFKGDLIDVFNGQRLSVDQQRVHELIILPRFAR